MGVDFQPGDYVAHPAHGACRVVGVGDVTAGGETFPAIKLAPLAHPRALMSLPLSKLASARLRVVSREEAEAMPSPADARSHHWRQRMAFYGARGGQSFKEKRRLARVLA